jgi:predicted cobalt transporter CbtA
MDVPSRKGIRSERAVAGGQLATQRHHLPLSQAPRFETDALWILATSAMSACSYQLELAADGCQRSRSLVSILLICIPHAISMHSACGPPDPQV